MVAQAQEYAKKSVEIADKSNDASEQITTRTILADALHQAGNISEAENHFRKSEEMQKKMQPLHPILYSLRGFHYCDLLLNQRKYKKVLSRAGKTLESVTSVEWFLDIAMDNLSIGRAYLLQAIHKKKYDFTSASEHLTLAVDGLRRSGQQYLLPHGLLSRSELYIVQEDFEKASHDLDEAMTIAQRGEMGLHQADCRLGYARLFLAMGNKEKARGELAIAKEMIGKMGYHRRDEEVKELEARLKL